MSDEKSVTEREAIERERKAFVAGVCRWPDATSETPIAKIAKDAAMIYPLPPRIVPRVVTDEKGDHWKVVGGEIVWSADKEHWCPMQMVPRYLTQHRVVLLADLLARPTEVSDE